MTSAVVLYHSRRGTTASYGDEIARELANRGVEVITKPLYLETGLNGIQDADYVFLGCWTSGLMFFGQRPEKVFRDYVSRIPNLDRKKVVLFTTYKILTGSMFRNMSRALPGKPEVLRAKFRSRTGRLSAEDQQKLYFLSSL